MTYDELVRSIELADCYIPHLWLCEYTEAADEDRNTFQDWQALALEVARMSHEIGFKDGYDKRHDSYSRGYESGYYVGCADAAGNPEEWYALDKNGEHLHFGDKFLRGNGMIKETIDRFDIADDGTLCVNGYYACSCEKVVPDTKEKIIDELMEILMVDEDQREDEVAEKFYNRIAAHVTQEIEADVQKRVIGVN